ncbi:MAG: flagellar motor protein MotB [bacterium]
MARKKKKGGGGEGAKLETAGGMRWLLTYADMITLLLGVFIILCASGSPSEIEIESLGKAFETVFTIISGGGGENTILGIGGEKSLELEGKTGAISNLKDLKGPDSLITRKYTQSFKSEIKKGKMTIKSTKDALVIRCYDTLLFDKDSDKINPQAYSTLDRIAFLILGISNRIAIEGHTDATPVHTPQFASNWELSTARATNVLHYLIAQAQKSGLSSSEIENFQKRLAVFGYAQFHPAVDDLYSKLNNRIDIVIYHHKTGEELLLMSEK